MVGILDRFKRKPTAVFEDNYAQVTYNVQHDPAKTLYVDESPTAATTRSLGVGGRSDLTGRQSRYQLNTGDKFLGGFGETKVFTHDYWTLRRRSVQLFHENLYGRGIVARLVTNEINTGLMPEANPSETVLGSDRGLADWAEEIEQRFSLWAGTPVLCDHLEASTWGEVQQTARLDALVRGDLLVVVRHDKKTKLPRVQLVCSDHVVSPVHSKKLAKGHTVHYGVERDAAGRQVAYWVKQSNGKVIRQPAKGSRSGARIAWLIYGTNKLIGDVRGTPLLSVVLQSLKEIDRYRDSAQRKAALNSIPAMQVTRSQQDTLGSLPMGGGAQRSTETTVYDEDADPRRFLDLEFAAGTIIDELEVGERLELIGGEGTDINFPEFEKAILAAIAWSLEIPPEIMLLSFSSNYSASQAAINEFKMAINMRWGSWGAQFCQPFYVAFIRASVVAKKVRAEGLLESALDPTRHDEYAAWCRTIWYGSIKPSTDMLKQAKGSELLVANMWSTNSRESRVLTGTKFSDNAKALLRENELKANALRPFLELEQEYGPGALASVSRALSDAGDNVLDFEQAVDDLREQTK